MTMRPLSYQADAGNDLLCAGFSPEHFSVQEIDRFFAILLEGGDINQWCSSLSARLTRNGASQLSLPLTLQESAARPLQDGQNFCVVDGATCKSFLLYHPKREAADGIPLDSSPLFIKTVNDGVWVALGVSSINPLIDDVQSAIHIPMNIIVGENLKTGELKGKFFKRGSAYFFNLDGPDVSVADQMNNDMLTQFYNTFRTYADNVKTGDEAKAVFRTAPPPPPGQPQSSANTAELKAFVQGPTIIRAKTKGDFIINGIFGIAFQPLEKAPEFQILFHNIPYSAAFMIPADLDFTESGFVLIGSNNKKYAFAWTSPMKAELNNIPVKQKVKIESDTIGQSVYDKVTVDKLSVFLAKDTSFIIPPWGDLLSVDNILIHPSSASSLLIDSPYKVLGSQKRVQTELAVRADAPLSYWLGDDGYLFKIAINNRITTFNDMAVDVRDAKITYPALKKPAHVFALPSISNSPIPQGSSSEENSPGESRGAATPQASLNEGNGAKNTQSETLVIVNADGITIPLDVGDKTIEIWIGNKKIPLAFSIAALSASYKVGETEYPAQTKVLFFTPNEAEMFPLNLAANDFIINPTLSTNIGKPLGYVMFPSETGKVIGFTKEDTNTVIELKQDTTAIRITQKSVDEVREALSDEKACERRAQFLPSIDSSNYRTNVYVGPGNIIKCWGYKSGEIKIVRYSTGCTTDDLFGWQVGCPQ